MPNKVYVINKHGRPLMPCSPAKARHLLDEGKAKVKKRTPFTIQLIYGSSGYTKKLFWVWMPEVRPLECRHLLQKRSCSPQK